MSEAQRQIGADEPMSTFRVTIDVGDPSGTRWESVEALADTGSTYTWVPTDVLQRLGVTPEDQLEFETAGGAVIARDAAETRVRIGGRAHTTIVVFGGDGSIALLGAFTLEAFLLAPDPVNKRLVPVRALAMKSRQDA